MKNIAIFIGGYIAGFICGIVLFIIMTNLVFSQITSETYDEMLRRIDAQQDSGFVIVTNVTDVDTITKPTREEWIESARNSPITFGMWYDYVNECSLDTIKATKYGEKDPIEYLISHDDTLILEWVNEKQLNDRGYLYRYRWIKNPLETGIYFDNEWELQFEHIFTKEPDLKRFIDWLIENNWNK